MGIFWGTVLGLLAAVGYTATNVGLRSVNGCDPFWVSCIKAWPTILLVTPWVLWHWAHRVRLGPPLRVSLLLIAGSLVGHLGGNVVFQWALGVIGIALTVPLTLGAIIVSGTIMGRVLLREPVTPRTALAVVCLVIAIGILAQSAADAYAAVVGSSGSRWMIAAGVGAAILAGVAYALLGVVIRYSITHGASVSYNLFVVAMVGAIALSIPSWQRLGLSGIQAISWNQYLTMFLAGSCNALAFLALTKAFQLTSMVYVNALNGSQAAMAAVAGVVIFHEAPSVWLWLGLALTLAGLCLLKPQHQAKLDKD